MVTIGCPFCSKLGILMVITGLGAIISGAAFIQPFLSLIGIILIIAAYIVPSSLDSNSCPTSTCSNTPSESPGEENRNERKLRS